MGIMSKILGSGGNRSVDDYVELDLDDFDTARGEAGMQVHIAEVNEQKDIIPVKDAVYDGDVVVVDITRLQVNDSTVEHILDDLRQVTREVDGDIIKKGDDQIIIVPTGVAVSREKLGTRS